MFGVFVHFVSLSFSYTKIMASPIFGKQFLVILMVNNLTHTHTYLIENIMNKLMVNKYIF